MNPLLVFDCEKVVPNRFELSLALAARTHQLNRGSEPRVELDGGSTIDAALREFAMGAFTPSEIKTLLAGSPQPGLLAPPGKFGGDEVSDERVAALPAPQSRDPVH